MARPRKTPEQVSASRRAAANKRHHPQPDAAEDQFATTGGEVPSETDRPTMPGHCAYDAVVGCSVGKLLFSYQDALQREKAIAAEMENVGLKEALEIRRGNLLSADQVRARDEKRRLIIKDKLDSFIGFAGSLVPPESGAAVREKAGQWVVTILAQLADELPAASR